jgi:hypothetical protein
MMKGIWQLPYSRNSGRELLTSANEAFAGERARRGLPAVPVHPQKGY